MQRREMKKVSCNRGFLKFSKQGGCRMKKRQTVRSNIYKRLIPLIPNKRYLTVLFVIKAGLLISGIITSVFYKLFVDNVLINKEIALLFPVIVGYIVMFALDTGLISADRIIDNKCFYKARGADSYCRKKR